MEFIGGIIIGLALGVGFHFHHTKAMGLAVNAGREQLRIERARRTAVEKTLALIRSMLQRSMPHRNLNLGGSVSLPDPARRTRQQQLSRSITLTEPPFRDGSGF
jgi:hypothetical protein